MNEYLEKLVRAYDYLKLQLSELPKGELMVVEKYNFGLVIFLNNSSSDRKSRIFPTTPYDMFHEYVRMRYWQPGIRYISGNSNSYFYVSRTL